MCKHVPDQSLCYSLEYSMTVKLLTEQRLEFLSLKGGCTGSPEPTLVKMPHCWKPRVAVLNVNFKLRSFLPHLETSGVRGTCTFQYVKVSKVNYIIFWSYSLLVLVSFFKKKIFVVACIQVIRW